MKIMLLILPLISLHSFANLNDCISDAREFGYLIKEQPGKACSELIRNHPDRIEVKSLEGHYKITALANLLYLDTLGGKNGGSLIKSETLAGDQTGLRNIKNVWIFEKKKKFSVLQSGNPYGLLTFTLAYASNTAPLRHFTSPLLNNATAVKLLDDREEIAIMSNKSQTVRFINSDADTVKYKGGSFKPLLLREIKGEDSLLDNPVDVVISDILKEVYVLDSGRILVFDLGSLKDAKPKLVINQPASLKNSVAIELDSEEGFLRAHLKSGVAIKIPTKAK